MEVITKAITVSDLSMLSWQVKKVTMPIKLFSCYNVTENINISFSFMTDPKKGYCIQALVKRKVGLF